MPRCLDDLWSNVIRPAVIHRDNGKCRICSHVAYGYEQDEQIPTWHYEVHHVEGSAEGGEDTLTNLVTLCAKCHRTVHGNNGFSRYETRKAQNRLEANL